MKKLFLLSLIVSMALPAFAGKGAPARRRTAQPTRQVKATVITKSPEGIQFKLPGEVPAQVKQHLARFTGNGAHAKKNNHMQFVFDGADKNDYALRRPLYTALVLHYWDKLTKNERTAVEEFFAEARDGHDVVDCAILLLLAHRDRDVDDWAHYSEQIMQCVDPSVRAESLPLARDIIKYLVSEGEDLSLTFMQFMFAGMFSDWEAMLNLLVKVDWEFIEAYDKGVDLAKLKEKALKLMILGVKANSNTNPGLSSILVCDHYALKGSYPGDAFVLHYDDLVYMRQHFERAVGYIQEPFKKAICLNFFMFIEFALGHYDQFADLRKQFDVLMNDLKGEEEKQHIKEWQEHHEFLENYREAMSHDPSIKQSFEAPEDVNILFDEAFQKRCEAINEKGRTDFFSSVD